MTRTPILALTSLALLAAAPNLWPDPAEHINFGNPVWADLDGDGDLDLFIVNHWFGAGVWRNDGAGRFTEVTAPEWAKDDDRHGVAMADYDRDGDLDVFLSMGAGGSEYLGRKKDQLWRNDGHWTFTNSTDAAGVANAWGRSRSPRWLDYDRDGDADLLVLNLNTPHVLYRNDGDGTFTDVSAPSGIGSLSLGVMTGEIGDYDADTWPDLFACGEGKDVLLRNDRQGHFVNVTTVAGLGARDRGRGAALFDADNDGDLDLFVARDFTDKQKNLTSSPDRIAFSGTALNVEYGLDFRTTGATVTLDLYLDSARDPSRVFLGSSSRKPAAIPFTAASSDPSLRGKPPHAYGTLGYYLWRDDARPDTWHLRWDGDDPDESTYFYFTIWTDGVFTGAWPVWFTPIPFSPIQDSFYRNNGNGTFTDSTPSSGLAGPGDWTSRGVAAGDFTNDGWLDLYLVNTGNRTVGKPPNSLFINLRNGAFADRAAQAGVQARVPGLGEGVALADFDRNGWLDLFTVQGRDEPAPGAGPHLLHANPGGSARWIELRLTGRESNPDAYGAWVILKAGGLRQVRYLGGGGSFFSQPHPGLLHFGLGAASQADWIEVRWPSGRIDRFTNVASNRIYAIPEGGPIAGIQP